MYGLDILVKLNTPFYEKGYVKQQRVQIVYHVISTSLFQSLIACLGILSTIYIASFELYVGHSYSMQTLIRSIGLLGFFKITELSQITRMIWERAYINPTIRYTFQLVQLICTLILLVHTIACIWIIVAEYEKESQFSHSWMNKLHI